MIDLRSLKGEILGTFLGVANFLSHQMDFLKPHKNRGFTFEYYRTDSAAETGQIEAELLREFEDQHWELPVLNAQRGYKRGEDKKYRG